MIVDTEIKVIVKVDLDRLRTWLANHGYARTQAETLSAGEIWGAKGRPSVRLPLDRYPAGERSTMVSWAIGSLAYHTHLPHAEIVAQIAATHTAIEEPML